MESLKEHHGARSHQGLGARLGTRLIEARHMPYTTFKNIANQSLGQLHINVKQSKSKKKKKKKKEDSIKLLSDFRS